MDIYNLERTKVILEMPWLVVHNPEIDWEKREVKMMRCPSLCGRNKRIEKSRKRKQVKRGEKLNKKVVKELVSKRFWRWKVFGKPELEYMLVQKAWDYTIELKERFVPKKEKVYLLSRKEQEEVQAFIKNQLYKEYI